MKEGNLKKILGKVNDLKEIIDLYETVEEMRYYSNERIDEIEDLIREEIQDKKSRRDAKKNDE